MPELAQGPGETDEPSVLSQQKAGEGTTRNTQTGRAEGTPTGRVPAVPATKQTKRSWTTQPRERAPRPHTPADADMGLEKHTGERRQSSSPKAPHDLGISFPSGARGEQCPPSLGGGCAATSCRDQGRCVSQGPRPRSAGS